MLKRFLASQRGNVALVTAALLPALFGLTGGAIDYGKLMSERSKLQGALDNTVLAAASGKFGSLDKLDETEASQYLQSLFRAAGGSGAEHLRFKLARMSEEKPSGHQSRIDDQVDESLQKYMVWGAAATDVDTQFLTLFRKLLGTDSAEASSGETTVVSAYSEAVASIRKNLEIVMVLDNTGSMRSHNRIGILKEASENFVTSMEELTKHNDQFWVKIGLVPFNTHVRFDARHKFRGWVGYKDHEHQAGQMGCLWDRPEPHDARVAFDSSDDEQYFPGSDDYYVGNYLYVREHCQTAFTLPLTENFGRIKAGINKMQADGNTNIALGLNWGWNLLDPGYPFEEGVSYDDPETVKIIILLTDGENTFNRRGYDEDNRRFYSSYRDVPTRANCDALKQTDIQVYTIRVVDGNEDLLRDCATSPDMFYDVRNPEEMHAVFERIAAHIRAVRLTF